MHDTVNADHVLLHNGEIVPRFARLLPNVLVVEEGETVTLDPHQRFDAVENAGLLTAPPGQQTVLETIHLLNLPTGRFELGTAEAPITGRAEVIFLEAPLDLARDPWQWGNGLLNLGYQSRVGQGKTPFVMSVGDIEAGATTLTLSPAPIGWHVGDELLIPDTRQQNQKFKDPIRIRRESTVTIAAISGNVVTLSKPLDFEHECIRRPDGSISDFPRVANLTHNVVIRSENPAGTRAHTANVGHVASWDVQYNQFVGVGRTTFLSLNNTQTVNGVIVPGTNQIGKYADHDHHCGSRPDLTRQSIGNSYQGTGGSKWAKVVHGTHDVFVQDCVGVDFQGGAFVTEDGWEVRNTFSGNLAAYSLSNGKSAGANADPNGFNAPGGEGVGCWFRGVGNSFIRNESWNNQEGISFFNRDQVGIGAVTIPGINGEPDLPYTAAVAKEMIPIRVEGNVTGSNEVIGLAVWSSQNIFPIENHVSVHNGVRNAWAVNSGNNKLHLVHPRIIGGAACRAEGVSSSIAYTFHLIIDGGEIRGCAKAVSNGGAKIMQLLGGLVLQNVVDISISGVERLFKEFSYIDVMHEPMPGLPPRYFDAGLSEPAWEPGMPLPYVQFNGQWLSQRGSPWVLRNWQGTGQSYRLLHPWQLGSLAAWPALDADHWFFVPEAGLTMAQAWAKYGMAFGGDVASGETLEGIGAFLVEPGEAPALGVPRAVMTYPNMLSPAQVDVDKNGVASVTLRLVLTGDYTQANGTAVISVDGGAPVRLSGGQKQGPYDRLYRLAGVEPGTHEVVAWREGLDGVKIPESEMTFRFGVGAIPNPDPEPDPDDPEPVHCAQGEWDVQTVSEGPWVNVGDHQEREVVTTYARVTLTEPEPGGTACGPSEKAETTIETQPMPWDDVNVQLSADDRVRVVRPDGTFKVIE